MSRTKSTDSWKLASLPVLGGLLVAAAIAAPARANEFTYFAEDFSADAANWAQSNFNQTLNHVIDDGPMGAGDNYVATNGSFSQLFPQMSPTFGTAIVFRGQQNIDSSQQAYVGNWIDDKVVRVELMVRHDFIQPISFGGRFAGAMNSPAASFIGADVEPNVWTPLTFFIDPANVFDPINNPTGQIVTFGGGDFQSVFQQISNIQVSVSQPAGLTDTQRMQAITFDLDAVRVTAVPEPSSIIGSALLSGIVLVARRWHRSV